MFAAKKRQNSSKLMVDPCDSWTQRVQEMYRAAGQDFRYCRTSDSFERGAWIGLAEFRDEEMSYERLNWSFDDHWPKKMRDFDEEVRVLQKRERWRRMKNMFEPCGVMYYTSRDQRIYRGEELPRCLLFDDTRIKNQNAYYWKRRRNVVKEQCDLKEPNWAKFDEIC